MITVYLVRCDKTNLQHLLGRKLLYRGLKELYGILPGPEGGFEIGKGDHGKPYLKEFPHIHYNVSHTKGLVACGFAKEPIGIDTEQARPFPEAIVKRVMSVRERQKAELLSEPERSEYLFRLWTLKESYVKAVGCGITLPLSGFCFEENNTCGLFFYQEILEGKYILSVCMQKEAEICLKMVEEKDIIIP